MLTELETRAIELLIGGKSYNEIALTMGVHRHAVYTLMNTICDKLHVLTRVEAAVKFDRMRAAWP